MTLNTMTLDEEQKVVQLTTEIAKAIIPLNDILTQLQIDPDEWEIISRTRTFKELLRSAQAEWSGASNTHKRAKLKAAAVIESVLPTFYKDMVNRGEQLASRAKVLETVAKIAGLGTPDPISAPSGNVFRLSINFADGGQPVTLDLGRGSYSESSDETVNSLSSEKISSKFLSEEPLED